MAITGDGSIVLTGDLLSSSVGGSVGDGATTLADSVVTGTATVGEDCNRFSWTKLQRTIRQWVSLGSGLPLEKVYWGEQDSPRPIEPAIELRMFSLHTHGLAWVDVETRYISFVAKTVPAVDPDLDTLTINGHGLGNGDGPVQIVSTATYPGQLAAETNYWVILVDDDTIKLAKTFKATGGTYVNGAPSGNPVTPIDITSAGSGTLTLVSTSKTLKAGQEIQHVSRALMRLGVFINAYNTTGMGDMAPVALCNRIRARQKLPSLQNVLHSAGLGLIDVQRPRAIHGVRNAQQFEARGLMEVLFSLATEECETDTIIESLQVTNNDTGQVFDIPE